MLFAVTVEHPTLKGPIYVGRSEKMSGIYGRLSLTTSVLLAKSYHNKKDAMCLLRAVNDWLRGRDRSGSRWAEVNVDRKKSCVSVYATLMVEPLLDIPNGNDELGICR